MQQLSLLERPAAADDRESFEATRERSIRRLRQKGDSIADIADRHSMPLHDVEAILGERHISPIDRAFTEFARANPRVLEDALARAREMLSSGATYISVKHLYEELRRAYATTNGADTFKLNNNHTAPLARWLCEKEPRLIGVVRTRERKA